MKRIALSLAASGALVGTALFLISPALTRPREISAYYHRNIAHRGLFSSDQSTPENSLAAFAKAAEAGYGIELDLQLTADGNVVVFHDSSLQRMTGVNRSLASCTLEELQQLRLFQTEETIPLFSDVLQLVGGRVPMIVEIKQAANYPFLCRQALDLMEQHPGTYCIESFDPRIVGWFRRYAPHVIRGQLSATPQSLRGETTRFNAETLGRCLFNFISRPHFIAYQIGPRPWTVRAAYQLGAFRVGWTSHDPSSEAHLDTVIFEHYLPDIEY